jgi:hypothetical protein
MPDIVIPLWFFLASLFVVMLWSSYLCGKKLHQLQEERDEALNQLDSARHSVNVLEKRVAELKRSEATNA